MAGIGSFFGKFFGRTIGDAASFAIGGAVERTIEPELQLVTNESWRGAVEAGVTKPLEAGDAAEIVAEAVELTNWGRDQANQTGIGSAEFDALVQAVLNAPGFGELLTILRRHPDATAQFEHGLRKNRLEQTWDAHLTELRDVRLAPAQIALGIVRSLIADPGIMPVTLDTSDSNVPKYPQESIDAYKEAADNGVTPDRLRVMVGEIGRPASPDQAARGVYRKILTEGAYNQAVLEGDIRPEWGAKLLDIFREISTAHDAVENHLRGYSQAQDMYDRTARHGMSVEDTDILFENAGRPLTVHQITTGLARGGQFNPETNELKDPYEASVHESNIKPSYYDLAIANRYNYPSLFQLNNLVKGSAITAAQATDWAAKDGYAPEVLDAMHKFWAAEEAKAGSTTGTKPKSLTYAQIHAAWSHGVFTDAQALAELTAIGYPPARAQTLLTTWQAQKTATSP